MFERTALNVRNDTVEKRVKWVFMVMTGLLVLPVLLILTLLAILALAKYLAK